MGSGDNELMVVECPFGDEACLGGRGSTMECGEGYEGFGCASCKGGYYTGEKGCVKCDVIWSIIGAILVVLFAGMVVYVIAAVCQR